MISVLSFNLQESILDATDDGSSPLSVAPPTSVPCLRVSRPSVTSIDSENLTLACADEDFARLAKARYVCMCNM